MFSFHLKTPPRQAQLLLVYSWELRLRGRRGEALHLVQWRLGPGKVGSTAWTANHEAAPVWGAGLPQAFPQVPQGLTALPLHPDREPVRPPLPPAGGVQG